MRTATLCTLILLLTALVSACGGGVAPEAQAALGKHLGALAGKDKAAIASTVVPEQRKGALGLSKELGITGATKPIKELTLDDLLQVEFFSAIKSATPNTDLMYAEGADGARLGASIEFVDGASRVKAFILKKTGDGWFVDMKATLDWWVKMDGASALSAIVEK
ncbi:MAG: hypothetical protein IT462_17015 [Planctomycetes bacterium]|nr:hypothetical protein [Planctomycetota bacterium]